MPYRIVKRKCKMATGNTGKAILQKFTGQKWVKVGCFPTYEGALKLKAYLEAYDKNVNKARKINEKNKR